MTNKSSRHLKTISYKLVLSGMPEFKEGVDEDVYLDDIPSDYKVYLLYYPGPLLNEDLENKLRTLGEITGRNLFVYIGRLDDPKYSKIASTFKIMKLPVIIITGVEGFASVKSGNYYSTAFVKLDNKRATTKYE